MADQTFSDRRDAGRQLGERLLELKPQSPVVYALPRGGVPVGFEVAKALRCPLDMLIVRKLGVPHQPELAMGALAEDGVVVRNSDVIAGAMLDEDDFAVVVEYEASVLAEKVKTLRAGHEPVSPIGHTAIVVDDGLATGSTALAAVSVLRQKGAESVWLAVPVAPATSMGSVERAVDETVVLSRPAHFFAVGAWYRDFSQTDDAEVRELLDRSRLP
ncbi:MAG: phosphoribosyltransferase family protein [Acidimicrobiia bacterium]|jgi:predicted phosphoribosyltransferase